MPSPSQNAVSLCAKCKNTQLGQTRPSDLQVRDTDLIVRPDEVLCSGIETLGATPTESSGSARANKSIWQLKLPGVTEREIEPVGAFIPHSIFGEEQIGSELEQGQQRGKQPLCASARVLSDWQRTIPSFCVIFARSPPTSLTEGKVLERLVCHVCMKTSAIESPHE
jgi:hypothetical protein